MYLQLNSASSTAILFPLPSPKKNKTLTAGSNASKHYTKVVNANSTAI